MGLSFAWSGSAAETIVDRNPQAVMRNRRYGNGRGTAGIQPMQVVKKMCCRLYQVFAFGQVKITVHIPEPKACFACVPIRGVQADLGRRCIMRCQLTGRRNRFGILAYRNRMAKRLGQRFFGDASGPQQNRLVKQADNGRLDPHGAGATVQNRVDPGAQPLQDMLCLRRADLARSVSRRRSNGSTKGLEQGTRGRVRWHAHREAVQSGGDKARHIAGVPFPENQRQWSGPERMGQKLCLFGPDDVLFDCLDIGKMYDQGIEAWPPLCVVNPRNRRIIPRIRADAVDGFGREGDQTSALQDVRGCGTPLGRVR